MKFTDLNPKAQRDRLTVAICLDRSALRKVEQKLATLVPGDSATPKLEARATKLRERIAFRESERERIVEQHCLRTVIRLPSPTE